MTKNKKPLPLLENVRIIDAAAEGKAIALPPEGELKGVVVFTQFAVPDDVVDIQVFKKKKNFAEGRVVKFREYSKNRCDAPCEHFGVCGGCKWQILPYGEQLRYKQQQVIDNLTRIGKIELPEIQQIIGAKDIYFYRNKLEFTFSNKKWLTEKEMNTVADNEGGHTNLPLQNMNGVGLHVQGKFDKVLDINKCWLQDDISNQIRNEIRRYAFDNNLTFFDLRKQEGFLRTLMIRNTTIGGLMVVVVFFYDDKTLINNALTHIKKTFPQITSLLYVVNSKCNDTITDQKINIFYGKDHIFEQMENLRFKIGVKSFYQTNSQQAYELYKVVQNFAELTENQLVYDLYTGTGTIANFVAKSAKKVIGIEYVPEAIDDARENSEINGITNTLFFAGDMKNVLTRSFLEQYGKPDVIITDPPRAGMHEDVIKAILFAEPQKIVYVSCNPATQARDLQLLNDKYKVTAVQPVDMFPHTHHVENVVKLEIKN
ncbi:MAG: 23S rRNA (uracil(1939)-C(5))-methyltransferase RlmD [Prevotellaceae bacterium]|jgi:23S rRNA (uracil1939-C5)-methyltransferase|nr:23S rRNA (uracil(1939)-C(5))-methyltransferase RlmD [Prevotellaceae bacterium]